MQTSSTARCDCILNLGFLSFFLCLFLAPFFTVTRKAKRDTSRNQTHHTTLSAPNKNMFDGDQFHQFIASSRTSLPTPLSFPLHAGASPAAPPPPPPPSSFPTFDPYHSHQTLQPIVVAHHHRSLNSNHQLQNPHHQLLPPAIKENHEKKKEDDKRNSGYLLATNLVLETERSIAEPSDPWSNDELLSLLRIRSSLEAWFPGFTWEHVSRKLAELGFKRSAEKCKEKYEDESSRHFNSLSSGGYNNNNNNKNYRIYTELDEIYHGDHQNAHQHASPVVENQNLEERIMRVEEKEKQEEANFKAAEEDNVSAGHTNSASLENDEDEVKKPDGGDEARNKGKKRKRKHHSKFEMIKGFCEAIVNKIMAQQEELHNKLIEDMLKRDEELIAREEAWKNQEMDRLKRETEVRAKEQALANDRQAILIDFLKKFTLDDDHSSKKIEELLKIINSSNSSSSVSTLSHHQQNPPHKVSRSTTLQEKLQVAAANNNITCSSSGLLVSQRKNHTTSASTPKNPHKNKIVPSSSSEITQSPQNPNDQNNNSSMSTLSMSTQKNLDENENHHHPLPYSSSPAGPLSSSSDIGKRWPRDEVLALINLRCSFNNNSSSNSCSSGGDDNKEAGVNNKGPLWERISQGMQELGYRRSAKRCKEKWENINKYFRKTKDNNKKRSLDSRTCPYFHQLSSLYSQGILVAPTDDHPPENYNRPTTTTCRATASPPASRQDVPANDDDEDDEELHAADDP